MACVHRKGKKLTHLQDLRGVVDIASRRGRRQPCRDAISTSSLRSSSRRARAMLFVSPPPWRGRRQPRRRRHSSTKYSQYTHTPQIHPTHPHTPHTSQHTSPARCFPFISFVLLYFALRCFALLFFALHWMVGMIGRWALGRYFLQNFTVCFPGRVVLPD